MKANPLTTTGRFIAAGVAAALGALGLAATAVAADPEYGNIDPGASGSIIVHKHLNGDGTQGHADGSGAEGANTVAGVQFTAYRIKEIDLTQGTTAQGGGWKTLNELVVPESACADPANPSLPGFGLVAAGTSPDTDAQGEATIGGLAVAAYLVCETKTPANIAERALPFVVSIPFPDTSEQVGGSTTNKWLYDVNVYPKNKTLSVNKSVNAPEGPGLGSTVTFPVTTNLPALAAGSYYTFFEVEDEFDSRLTAPTVQSITAGATTLTQGADYTVVTAGQKVTAVFTTAGLAALKEAGASEAVVTYSAKASGVGDGQLLNSAKQYSGTQYAANQPDAIARPADALANTTNTVSTAWGDAVLLKYDADKQEAGRTGLQGAEFQVFESANPTAAQCGADKKAGAQPISVNGQDTFVSDAEGVVTIPGLYVSDEAFAADAASFVTAQTTRCYVIVETKAPQGYVLDSEPKELTVTAGTTAESTYALEIGNHKQLIPGLPLTGANGALLLTIGGAVLILLAVGTTLIGHRRRRA